MAFEYGFYNSINGDRKYNAVDFGKIFDGIINDGIFESIGSKFFTTVGDNAMDILVGTGKAWFDHTWNLNTTPMIFTISQSHPVLTRYDAVVLEINETADVYGRVNEIKVVEGTPSSNPVKPTLVNSDYIHQHPLAYVKINPGVTTLTAADIEITVGQESCPFVTSILETTDITGLFANWQSQFETWFNNLKAQLTDDVVTNLQNQIDNCLKVTDIATQDDIEAATEGKVVTAPFLKDIRIRDMKIGDIIQSTRNLEEETNGMLIACDQRSLLQDSYPDFVSMPDIQKRINPMCISIYDTNTNNNFTPISSGVIVEYIDLTDDKKFSVCNIEKNIYHCNLETGIVSISYNAIYSPNSTYDAVCGMVDGDILYIAKTYSKSGCFSVINIKTGEMLYTTGANSVNVSISITSIIKNREYVLLLEDSITEGKYLFSVDYLSNRSMASIVPPLGFSFESGPTFNINQSGHNYNTHFMPFCSSFQKDSNGRIIKLMVGIQNDQSFAILYTLVPDSITFTHLYTSSLGCHKNTTYWYCIIGVKAYIFSYRSSEFFNLEIVDLDTATSNIYKYGKDTSNPVQITDVDNQMYSDGCAIYNKNIKYLDTANNTNKTEFSKLNMVTLEWEIFYKPDYFGKNIDINNTPNYYISLRNLLISNLYTASSSNSSSIGSVPFYYYERGIVKPTNSRDVYYKGEYLFIEDTFNNNGYFVKKGNEVFIISNKTSYPYHISVNKLDISFRVAPFIPNGYVKVLNSTQEVDD